MQKKEAKMRKGQAANEIAIIIGIMILFLIAFMSVLGDQFVSVTDDRTKQLAEDLADVAESELVTASNAQDGYSRMFSLPPYLDGATYAIVLNNASTLGANFSSVLVSINTSNGEYSAMRILPGNVLGAFSEGANMVRKRNGLVNLTAPLS
jgi:hypothetical protein